MELVQYCDCDVRMARLLASLDLAGQASAPKAPATRGLSYNRWLWENGRTLGVAFSGGSMGLRREVQRLAELWPANIKWDWQRSWAEAEIRIELFGEGGWSYIGTSALWIAAGKPTMRLGWAQEAFDNGRDEVVAALTLHEFGHALGLAHEQHNPVHNIPWDHAALHQHFVVGLGWEWEQVQRTYLDIYAPPDYSHSGFDAKSVMIYPVDNRWTIGNYQVPWMHQLSAGDRAYIRTLYPTGTVVVPPVVEEKKKRIHLPVMFS